MRLTALAYLRDLVRGPRDFLVLYLDRSTVHCPTRGDVDLELCLACPHLRGLAGDPIDRIECVRRYPLPEG
jgi:hypothetical protein